MLESFDQEERTIIVNKWYLQKETGKIASPLFLAAQEKHLDICRLLLT